MDTRLPALTPARFEKYTQGAQVVSITCLQFRGIPFMVLRGRWKSSEK